LNSSIAAKQTSSMDLRQRDPEFHRLPEPARLGRARAVTRTATDVAMSATANRYTECSMDERKYLTAEEVSERYRGSVSVGTLRNWRAMKVGPPFIKIGKAVLYPIDELEVWDRKSTVTCRASKRLTRDPRDEA
jgi:hypothetical protein